MSFLNILFFYYFSSESETVLQGMDKNDSAEKKVDAEVQARLKHAPE